MNRLLAATALAVPLALGSLAAFADEGKTPAPATPTSQGGSFDTLDANKDGRISMPEASADPKLVEIFSTADKNGDGYLDAAEYANAISNQDRTREPKPQ